MHAQWQAHARSGSAGATGLGHRGLLSLQIDLPKPCTYRNMSSIPPRDPLLPITSPSQTACSCVQPELGSPRPNFIRCQPVSQPARLLTAAEDALAAGGTPRASFARRASGAENAGQGSALDVFPTKCQGCSLSIHVCPVRPFLARFLYSLMHATNKQASKQQGLRASRQRGPRLLALSPFLPGAELSWVEEERREDGQAGWARRQQHLAREGIDKNPRNPPDQLLHSLLD